MSKPSIYIETSIVSYLVGWLNPADPAVAYNQRFTREWWSTRREDFDLFVSQVVFDEARKGDPQLAAQRLQYLDDVGVVEVTAEAQMLSAKLLRRTGLPTKAEIDSLHIAIAAVNGLTYLLTWNCAHIANAFILPSVYAVCRDAGYEPPLVCTPLELLG